MKKLTCIILSFIILLGASLTVFAETTQNATGTTTTSTADVSNSTTSESDTSEPSTSEPSTSEPGTSEPSTSEPGTSEPGTSEPDTSEPSVCTTHNFTNYTVSQAPTCEENGKITATCTVCNTTADFTILASHHPDSDGWETIKAPSCEEKGESKKHCNLCNTDVIIELNATGHTEVVIEKVDPTCTEDGLSEGKKCSVCGEVLTAQEEIPKTGHTEVTIEKVEPTCTEAGHSEGKKCSVCNEITVEPTVLPAKGHTEAVIEKVDPTCTEDGLSEGKKCSVCDEVLVAQEKVPATGHKWATDNKTLKCENCDVDEPIKEITSAKCDQEVFIKDSIEKLTFTLEVTTENDRKVTVEKIKPTIVGLDTEKPGKQNVTITYNGVSKENIEITVKKPTISVSLGKEKVYNNEYKNLYRDGITFTVTSSSKDEIIADGGEYFTVDPPKGNRFTVHPTKYFKYNPADREKYHVEFSFKRNGEVCDKLRINLNYVVTSVKCTGTTYFVQGTGKKKTKITYIETYNDGHSKESPEEEITIDTTIVGRKTYKFNYYDSVPFVCYVKCKTPVVTAKGDKKSVKLSWKKVEGATGYKVYRATSKNGKYSMIKSITSGSTLKYTNTGLGSKKTYYYKVVAVYKPNSNCNSSYSTAKKATTK